MARILILLIKDVPDGPAVMDAQDDNNPVGILISGMNSEKITGRKHNDSH